MQDVGEVSRSAQGAPVHTWVTELLQWSTLLLCVAYLVSTSMGGLAPVASRVIRWASARHKPALSVVVMARLARTGHGQAQRLWASAWALIRRQALHPHPATSRGEKDLLAIYQAGVKWRCYIDGVPVRLCVALLLLLHACCSC